MPHRGTVQHADARATEPGMGWQSPVDVNGSCTQRGLMKGKHKLALRQSLQSFPSVLVPPLLHLVTLTHRTRLHEMCDDVYSYMKERFFAGETVDVVGRTGVRQLCRILEVQSPHSNGALNGHVKHHMEGDAIVISDSDEEGSSNSVKSPIPPFNGKKKASISPSVFKYKVLPLKMDGCEPFIAKAAQISRKKSVFSRDRLKLLLKQHCEPQNGAIRLKAATIAKYKLAEHSFSYFFPDEPPVFPFSPPGKGRGRPPNGSSPEGMSFTSEGESVMRAAEEKLRLMQQKEEMMTMALEKARLKKEREDAWEARKKEKEDRERKRNRVGTSRSSRPWIS